MKTGAVSWMFAAAVLGLSAMGCGAREPEETTLPKTEFKYEEEPQFSISKLSALAKANSLNSVPFLASAEGLPSEQECYVPAKQSLYWKTANPSVLKQLKSIKTEIENAILAWSKDSIFPDQSSAFQVSFEQPVIRHASLDSVRLSPQQECVTNPATLFPNGARTITTLFGAHELFYESTSPISQQVIKKMGPKAKAAKCVLKSKPYDYPQATDGRGKPLKDEKGRLQFKGPDGELLKKKDLPKPNKRPVFEWSLSCKEPVYFAVGDLQPEAWSNEADPAKCTVNLIYWDATPRLPNCAELTDAAFGVEEIPGTNEVMVKVTADGETVTRQIPFNERQSFQVAGRIVVWVVPTPIEEGALLSIDSFVLAPNTGDKTLLQSWKKPKK
ncbi:MAG: hypothetical protein MUC50_13655 [Myxococcota bacterium]|nr:hypothetical protein [Myxococcota bacterium]